MNKRLLSYHFITLLVLLCSSEICTGQSTSPYSLTDQLSTLEKQYDVQFSYNHTFFDNIIFDHELKCDELSECISILEARYYLNFTNNTADNYLIIPQRKDINFKLQDSDTGEYITTVIYKINLRTQQNAQAQNNVFTLKNIFPLDSIQLTTYFYKEIKVQAKELLDLKTIKLHNQQFHLNEIILNSYITQGIDARISDHGLQIKTESLGLLAGETDGDLFNALQSVPGIHSPSGKSGNLNFRGSTYDQNLIQIDDIPIYHSGHFLGAISPYNTAVITQIDVQRNMLPAKYGGRAGGLINMTTSDEIPESNKYHIAVNTLFTGATVHSKVIEDKLSVTAAFRTSYPNIKSPKLEAISTLIFQGSRLDAIADQVNSTSDFNMSFSDMNAKVNYKINEKHSTTLSFINIQNNLNAQIKSNSSNDETDFRDLELDNWGITGKWQAQFNDKLSTQFRLSTSQMNLVSLSQGFVLEQRSRFQEFDNTISDSQLITEMVYNYKPDVTFEAGYSLTHHELVSNEVEEENNINSKRDQKGTVHSNYVSVQKNWNDQLIMNIGLRNNYYAPTQELYLNPRITSSYAIDHSFYLKSSIGTSNQFIQKKLTNDFDDFNITNQLWFLPNDEITTLKGTQAMVGGVYDNHRWLVDVELFSRKTDEITNKADDTLGSITSVGANVFVKRKWNLLETWISYALSKTQTDFNSIQTDAFFDQRHVLNLTGLLNLNRWKFSVSWNYNSGMPVIYSNENNSELIPIQSDRFDPIHQLDFSSSYTFYNNLESVKTVIGLSILNVYDADNTVNIFQNTTENTFRKASAFSPNLQVSLFF